MLQEVSRHGMNLTDFYTQAAKGIKEVSKIRGIKGISQKVSPLLQKTLAEEKLQKAEFAKFALPQYPGQPVSQLLRTKPAPGIPKALPSEISIPPGQKERKFFKTVEEAQITPEQIKVVTHLRGVSLLTPRVFLLRGRDLNAQPFG